MAVPPASPEPRAVLQEDRLTYTPLPRSVRLARMRTARLVGEVWGLPEIAGDAAVIVSELSSNAIFHGRVSGRLFRVQLTRTAGTLRIEVTDPRTERLPEPRLPADDQEYGRGLLLVGGLSSRWGTEPLVVGKTVWAEIDLK
ncbi:ATP-binding protein [Streptomyces avicenniae]|uniref:ATP-binding protein n=1 Tax=Streptomyces avicenniae TaxID=500153 RepID=UPI00069AD30F|nr:ATP-binding protein [Streptomyces avicenniae]